MKSMYIERHNEAARLIVAEILKGKLGNRINIICADVGSSSKAGHLEISDSRIPKDVISDCTLQRHGINTQDRSKIRPDALILESTLVGVPATGKRTASRTLKPSRVITNPNKDPPTRPCKAFILEVGYTSETRYTDKVLEKTQQHAQLRSLLESEGFEGVIQSVILGTSGGIFLSQGQILDELGVEKSRRDKLNRKLHLHSIHTMHSLIQLRRQKEAKMQKGHQVRKKKPPDK